MNKNFGLALRLLVVAASVLSVNAFEKSTVVKVKNAEELKRAVANATPGATINLAPGNYGNGFQFERVNGTEEKPISIMGEDHKNPPLFTGGNQALHFVDCNYVRVVNIKVKGCRHNGINADDGGSFETPSQGMLFDSVVIEDIGPRGNFDGLKLSGLTNFKVVNCSVSGWGGSAIDMVGCRRGQVSDCHFTGKQGFSQDTGIQAKGGSENIAIHNNMFLNAGQRAVNLGGSTGLPYFRPEVRNYEAKDLVVSGNCFTGSLSPIAYVTSVDCRVVGNTIYMPDKWVLRILQEQPVDKFLPCGRGVFEKNLVGFDRRGQTFVNVGVNTSAETFIFKGNAWFCVDGNRRPELPVKETDGIYQVDPELKTGDDGELSVM